MPGRMYCYNCGNTTKYKTIFPVDDDLINKWEISQSLANLFNKREGFICGYCGASKRAQALAHAILKSKYGYMQHNLKAWVKQANKRNLRVCELNSCHKLHDTFQMLNNLTYSEYGTESEQNIEQLKYADNSFDLVLHSETLEHVNDPVRAMVECRRVVKPNGLVMFTIPIIWGRKTRKRAHLEGKKIVKDLAASYHGNRSDDYLVFSEFGRDATNTLESQVIFCEPDFQNYVLASTKEPRPASSFSVYKLRLLEKFALRKEAAL